MNADRHIVIIGLMGSGKTTIGRLLARRLARTFVDNDDRLERTSGRTAAAIAHDDGVDALHEREAIVLRDALDSRAPAVITGAASTVLDADLRDRLRTATFVIWLTAEPGTLARRTAAGPSARPRLASDLLTLAERQRVERDHLFADVADLLVSTDESIESVVDDVVANLPPGVVPPVGDA